MASVAPMTDKNVSIAEAYYKAMGDHDAAAMEKYLHPEVQVITPMEQLSGREAVLEAGKKLMNSVRGIKIKTHFGSDEYVALGYEMDCGPPTGVCHAAALMTFKNGQIFRNNCISMRGHSRKQKAREAAGST